MCGIVGYTGEKQCAPILLEGLKKLEYRGYDSAGIAVRNGQNDVEVVKAKGKLKHLFAKTYAGKSVKGACGIGHTRWATHGEPSEKNAHPHISNNDKNVVAVHNGIIENFIEIKEKLVKNGYKFYSQTDTEALTKLIDYYYKKYKMGPIDAIAKSMVRVRGSYAIAVMFKEYPGEIYVARKDSPMIIGVGKNESFIASDVPAILSYTNQVYYMDNFEMARLSKDDVTFYNLDGEVVEKQLTTVELSAESAEKGNFAHFMMKEIYEQPKAIEETYRSVLDGNAINLSKIGLDDLDIKDIPCIHIVACGSAYHVGMVAQYVFEDLVKIPVRVELASEFRYRNPLLLPKDLVIVISQSGETADTLAGLREAKKAGVKTLAIVNVAESSIAREADSVFYTLAGPEIAVATTKAYSAQLVSCYLLAVQFAKVKGQISDEYYNTLIEEIKSIPSKIAEQLEDKETIQKFANAHASEEKIFFIGRGVDYAVSLEGSLKCKEISYIHSEAYAAGELKHGTISLIEKGTLVFGLLTQQRLFEKTISNLAEVKSRGAYLMGITVNGNYTIENTVDFAVFVPSIDEHFTASLAVVPMQLFSYYASLARGLDPDKPRNLAKSVTVE